jgi:uncharacterized protein YjbI with pentapeptide repeats
MMKIWRERLANFLTVQRVGILLIGLSILIGIFGYANEHPGEALDLHQFISIYYANISSELFGIAVTVLIIDSLNRRRDEMLNQEREQEQLIRQLGSTVNEVAKRASEELRAQNWLTDGTLQGADLRVANLEDARLWKADFQGANLQWAKLNKANLNGAVLVGANLVQAKLTAAKLNGADLRGANLREARMYRVSLNGSNLRDADLTGAYLQGARLEDADLTGALLDGAHLDEYSVCPDGASWQITTDMTRFCDPAHPNYFHSRENNHKHSTEEMQV